ncbi:MAG: shikimate dehydrogenase, partial [Actinobacteria bacterium]|nr:shikimate dehydrogenase [Actinomycetota bacterium]
MDTEVKINSSTDLYALFGYPAKHSFSPFIQNYFFKRNNINSVYLSFEIKPSDINEAFNGAKKIGFSGLNLTMPFKETLIDKIDEMDNDAGLVKSVNTIKFNNTTGRTRGFNTDIPGFIKSLDDVNFTWNNSACLVIGAGGVAKSSIYSLIKKNTAKIYLYNRTIKKAFDLKSVFYNKQDSRRIVVAEDLNSVPLKEINLIVNCSSAGMNLKSTDSDNVSIMPVPEDWDLKNKIVFEMVYDPVITRLVKKSLKDGAKIIYGTDMLLNQAA